MDENLLPGNLVFKKDAKTAYEMKMEAAHMKKYLIGLLSIFLMLVSILGMQTKATKGQRAGRGSDPAMWV